MGKNKEQVRHCPTTIQLVGILLVTGLGLSCSHRGSVVVGGACSSDEACTTNVCIGGGKASAWVGGYCSGKCVRGTLDCPQGDCLPFDDGHSYCVAKCDDKSDCRDGYICSPGVNSCLPDCRQGWSCGERLICDTATGACTVPVSSAGNTPFGKACVSWQECATELCIHEQANEGNVTWSGGMCSQKCDTAATCPDGGPCVHFEDGSAYCVPPCTTTCREGYVCSAGVNGCLPDCRLGWECGERLVCDAATGACTSPPGDAPLGSTCTQDTECASALCIPERGDAGTVAWSGGMCSLECANASCPAGAACLRLDGGTAYCVPSCAGETDCRTGYICSAEVAGCLPDCRLGWDCGERLVCDAATGTCAGNAPLGSACTYNAECASALCIPERNDAGAVSWTAGTCSQKCTSDCPAGATCVHLEDGNGYCAVSCAATTECRAGYVCSAEACLPDCRLGWDCGQSLLCDATTGACMPPPGTEPVGSPCTDSAECASALCIPERSESGAVSWTEGTCSQECTTTLCPVGATCAHLEDGSSYCVPSCTSVADCRAGYVCSVGIGGCLPDCRLGWDCGDRYVCDANTGACTASTTTTGTALGDPCTLSDECASALCIPERGSTSTVAWSGGTCSQECTTTACPAEATCVPMEDGSAYCVPSCASSADCRADYICDIEVFACLPDCRLGWSCGTRLVCDAVSGSCVLPSSSDAGAPDGGYSDGGYPDAGYPDAGYTDGSRPDAGVSDTGWRGPGDSGGSGPGGNDARGGGPGPGGMLSDRALLRF